MPCPDASQIFVVSSMMYVIRTQRNFSCLNNSSSLLPSIQTYHCQLLEEGKREISILLRICHEIIKRIPPVSASHIPIRYKNAKMWMQCMMYLFSFIILLLHHIFSNLGCMYYKTFLVRMIKWSKKLKTEILSKDIIGGNGGDGSTSTLTVNNITNSIQATGNGDGKKM